jgi:hypothetical protein
MSVVGWVERSETHQNLSVVTAKLLLSFRAKLVKSRVISSEVRKLDSIFLIMSTWDIAITLISLLASMGSIGIMINSFHNWYKSKKQKITITVGKAGVTEQNIENIELKIQKLLENIKKQKEQLNVHR